MIHPDTELRHVNDVIGYGVFATAFIPAGTITWVLDELDQTFTQAQVEDFPPCYRAILDKYCFTNAAGRMVLCWDHARFVNHSCEPTCLSAGYDFEITVCDVQPGQELTDDYGTLNLHEDFTCSCGSLRCRKIIRPDDIERYATVWDGLVEPLFRQLRAQHQPLWPFLKDKKAVEDAVAGTTPYRSIRHHYHSLA